MQASVVQSDGGGAAMLRRGASIGAPVKDWQYNVLAWKSCEDFAQRLEASDPKKFVYHPTVWEKFPDSKMDHIIVGGFTPQNVIARSHVFFLAAFDDNDAIMSQLHVLTMLCESFIKSLTIYIPYFPVATMERVVREGEVATANTLSRVLSALPRFGSPARVMFYDLHTLQVPDTPATAHGPCGAPRTRQPHACRTDRY